MQTQEVEIQPDMRIALAADNELLDEVIVVGYGTAKKVGTVIGSVATVSSEKIAEKPVINVMDALQGQVAGLQVFTNSGDPGDKSMRSSSYLRGVGSLSAGTEPLYVLDGSPVSSEIMSMMRAANGVIYITTKRGRAGEKALVTVSGNYGVSMLARRIGTPMNTEQYLGYLLGNGVIDQDYYDHYMGTGVSTDWEDYFFENAPMYQGNISVQGGSDRTMYYLSASYLNQEGIEYGSGYERYTVRANVETQVNNWLRMGANLAGAYDMTQASGYTYQGSNNLYGGILGSQLYARCSENTTGQTRVGTITMRFAETEGVNVDGGNVIAQLKVTQSAEGAAAVSVVR